MLLYTATMALYVGYLFISVLFNQSVSYKYYTASNSKMFNE
jgi:hypothetical protein